MNCAIETFLDADTVPENKNNDIWKLHKTELRSPDKRVDRLIIGYLLMLYQLQEGFHLKISRNITVQANLLSMITIMHMS
jgi:hypothetical protein